MKRNPVVKVVKVIRKVQKLFNPTNFTVEGALGISQQIDKLAIIKEMNEDKAKALKEDLRVMRMKLDACDREAHKAEVSINSLREAEKRIMYI